MNNERDEKGGEFEENWWTGKQCKKPLLHFSFTLTRGALSARSSGRFEPDSGATADHNDGLARGVAVRAGWERRWLRCS